MYKRQAHHLSQRADGGLVDIRHLKAGGVHLVARAHGADDGGTGPVSYTHLDVYKRQHLLASSPNRGALGRKGNLQGFMQRQSRPY